MSLATSVSSAWIIGVGLIGGSIGKALRQNEWTVYGTDLDNDALTKALSVGAIDKVGPYPECDVVFVCVPSSSSVEVIKKALTQAPEAIVSDVAGVKESICSEVVDPRFIGGHPMAGSEKLGVSGSDSQIFEGRAWVLTPNETTDPAIFAKLHGIVTLLGARPIAMSPKRHDILVATVSHLPHLLAASLMNLAGDQAEEFAELLLLAAGGFRDMTRISSSDPQGWPDICIENKQAIGVAIDAIVERLAQVNKAVANEDREAILSTLISARQRREMLPAKGDVPLRIAQISVRIQDRPGALAQITTKAAQMGINIEDLAIAHALGGGAGTLYLSVDESKASDFMGQLQAEDFHAMLVTSTDRV